MSHKINNEYVSPAAVGEPRQKVYINSTSKYVKRNASGARLGVYDLPNFSKKVCWLYSRFDNQTASELNVQTPVDPESITVDYVCFSWMYNTDCSALFFGVKDNVRYSKWSNQGQFPYSDYYNADGTINGNNLFALQNGGLEIYKTAGPNILVQANRETDRLPVYTCNILDDAKFSDTEPHDTDFIVTEDLYLDGYRPHFGINNRFILDGGNLIKYYTDSSTPDKIICRSGNLICKNPDCFDHLPKNGFGSFTIKHPTTGAHIPPLGDKGDYDIVFDAADFMTSSDYVICNDWVTRIDLNSILDRIVDAIIPHPDNTSLNMLVQFPQTNYGNGFYMRKTFDVPYGMTIDFGGINIWISNNYLAAGQTLEFKSALEWDTFDSRPHKGFNYAFGFTRHPSLSSIIIGTIRNTTIWVQNDVVPNQLRMVLNLRHFSGILENVNFNLKVASPYLLAMWQPYATSANGYNHESYSDNKIIRRCSATIEAGRTDTPVALFCNGDGFIIQQCNLGYVAIIDGRGGVIEGCLNTKYFFYGVSVNIVDAYFEIGQFEILNSQVKFSSGQLTFDNNIPQNKYGQPGRRYFGPLMAVDMDFSHKRLRHFLKDLHVNCNDVFWEKNDNTGYPYIYHKKARPSKVEFAPSLTAELIYWGYRQPMSGQIITKGDYAQLIGLENFESVQQVFANERHATLPALIPLVNNQFTDWKTVVEVPDSLKIERTDTTIDDSSQYYATGTDWDTDSSDFNPSIDYPDPNPPTPGPDVVPNENRLSNVHAFIELDNTRRLRSYVINYDSECKLHNGIMPGFTITADFSHKEYKNLKVVFRCAIDGEPYEARMHFKHLSHITETAIGKNIIDLLVPDGCNYDIASVDGQIMINNGIKKITLKDAVIAGFNIMKANQPLETYFTDTDFSLDLYNEYGYNQPGVKYKHTYGNFEYIGDDNTRDQYTECSKLIPLNEVNVRAYVNQVPLYGEWAEGDEIIVTYNDGGHEWLIYMHGFWMNPYSVERTTK